MRLPASPLHNPHANVIAFPGLLYAHGHDAAGMRAGHAEDAAEGLGSITDGAGLVWYWNTAMSEWQRAHTVASGDTLWKLTKVYYGAFSLSGVHAIHNVPQNLAIQGPSADVGLIPGDVILIPGLPQPAPAPAAANDPPLSMTQTVPAVVDTTTQTLPGDGTVAAQALPAGWPEGVDYPPTGTVPTTTTLPEMIIEGEVPATGDVVPVKTGTAIVKKPAEVPFWTGGRVAIAAVLATAGIGTIVYLATRPKRRRRRR